MSLDISKLNENVLEAVRQHLGCEDPDDESRDVEIAAMSPREVFEKFLNWEGIIRYGATIWDAVESIKAATLEEKGGSK